MSSLILPPGYSSNVSTQGLGNRPERNEQREAEVRAWLQGIDSSLDVKWFEDLRMYGYIVHWPSIDPRLELIRKGEIGNAPYDILAWASEDPHNGNSMPVAVDEMETKILEVLASADNSRSPWKDRLKSMAEKNIEHKRKIRESFREQQAHDIAGYYRNEALGIHQVNVPTEIK